VAQRLEIFRAQRFEMVVAERLEIFGALEIL
jgi:hypothetical protein